MAHVQIGGHPVEISDDFLRLAPAEQQAIIGAMEASDPLASQAPQPAPQGVSRSQALVDEIMAQGAQAAAQAAPEASQQEVSRSQSLVDEIMARAPEAEPQSEPGFFSRIGERLSERGETFREITAAPPETTVESLEKGLQVLGTGAGAALDVVGETVSTGFELLGQVAGAITPDFIEDPIVSKVGDALESIVGGDVAQKGIEAAGKGIEAYTAWAEENPRAAKNVAALANIALVAAPVRGKPRARVAPEAPAPRFPKQAAEIAAFPRTTPVAAPPSVPRGTVLARGAEGLEGAATEQLRTRTETFLADLVRPKATAAVKKEEILRSAEGGVFRGRAVEPSTSERLISEAVGKVAEVDPKNTLLQNLNRIQEGVKAEANTLSGLLKGSTVKIPRADMKSTMDDVLATLAENPILVGDAAKVGERTVAKARTLLDANPKTPAGVLKARQQFDEWVKTQRPKIFDPTTESALSIAVRETRTAMNGIIEKSVPDIAVRDSLAMQSNLFRALDNIGPKAADEAGSVIGRLRNRVTTALGLKKTVVPALAGAAAAAGVSVAAPVAAAGLALTAGVALGASKLVQSPAVKQGLASLLRKTDKAIQIATKNGDTTLARQLRADRAAVLEIVRSGGEGPK